MKFPSFVILILWAGASWGGGFSPRPDGKRYEPPTFNYGRPDEKPPQIIKPQIGERLSYFVDRFQELAAANESTDPNRRVSCGAALSALIQDRRIIPQGGVVHIPGPYANAGEWLVYLLLRKDIRVIVSESAYQEDDPRGFEESFSEEIIGQWWDSFLKHPELTALMNQIEINREELLDLVKNRHAPTNRLLVAYSTDGQPAPVPLADFVMALMPQHSGRRLYPGYGKPEALGWVLTESFASEYEHASYATPTEKMVRVEIRRSSLASFGEGPLSNWLRSPLPPYGPSGKRDLIFQGSVFTGLGRPYLFEVK